MRALSFPRWRAVRDPFQDGLDLFTAPFDLLRSYGELTPRLDLRETDDEIVVSADVPGVAPEDLELEIHEDVLTLKGERKAETEKDDERGHTRERVFGSFHRRIRLPAPVDASQAEAKHENGVVTIRLPKSEEARPRRIAVRAS